MVLRSVLILLSAIFFGIPKKGNRKGCPYKFPVISRKGEHAGVRPYDTVSSPVHAVHASRHASSANSAQRSMSLSSFS